MSAMHKGPITQENAPVAEPVGEDGLLPRDWRANADLERWAIVIARSLYPDQPTLQRAAAEAAKVGMQIARAAAFLGLPAGELPPLP